MLDNRLRQDQPHSSPLSQTKPQPLSPVLNIPTKNYRHPHHHIHHPPRSSAHGLPLRIINNNIIQGAESDIEEIISDEEGRTIIANEHGPRVVKYINHHQPRNGQRSRSGNRLLEPETRHGERGYFVPQSVLADLVRK